MDTDPIYDAYAPIYERTGRDRFGAYLAHLTLTWLRARQVEPRRALDLACGTGGATLALAAAGISTTGVDRSPAMLQIARRRAQDVGLAVTFVAADMRYLENVASAYAGCFELVTCFGDSINYLTDDGDLRRVFGGIQRALSPGGYVVFDVNTEAAFARWDESDLVVFESDDCLVYNRLAYNPATRLGIGRIVWFVRGNNTLWQRGEEMHIERAWSDAEIQHALADAGLELVARLDVTGRTLAENDLPERLIMVARLTGK
ncbi:MAG: class I SAM-dependent methyltransferase [Roseiflexus sp.]|jgi:SAM-dependent methyltransferase|nr:class I SAM-dependent methyltransferase [Roseiflexus sp.]MBO9333391.1 class I SAM-dependent methyltransferase [Roseiflexus sp.]MBO9365299.1 class I SAM-dependent methyltransferase [Roseiflexus sp.]MBO9383242.1 class I SAM-dependent methyltransferase [Roseiflexus sp.]MBO9388959.1 class I SAM-dependent methyltransferase [Roseiflexus sp.]